MDIQKHQNNQVTQYQPNQHSKKLIQCLIGLEVPEKKSDAKMELIAMTLDLMPQGKPSFLDIVKYPKISQLLEEHGKKTMFKVVFLLVKDFCSSLNVVRNMNEDQMIEAAAMLIDECGNFRMEDYVMMFQMGKKGDLVKIMDRIDISMITLMLDEYWLRRRSAADQHQTSEAKHLDSLGSTTRKLEQLNSQDARLIESADRLTAAIEELKTRSQE